MWKWHDEIVRFSRGFGLTPVLCAIALLTFAMPVVSTASNIPVGTTDTSVPAVYDLENTPSECIGFLPKPNCGKKPQDAGERGGTLQYIVFGTMMLGLGVIAIGIMRSTKRQKPQS